LGQSNTRIVETSEVLVEGEEANLPFSIGEEEASTQMLNRLTGGQIELRKHIDSSRFPNSDHRRLSPGLIKQSDLPGSSVPRARCGRAISFIGIGLATKIIRSRFFLCGQTPSATITIPKARSSVWR